MPIATLRYTLPDEQADFDAARLGRQMVAVIWEIDQRLRSLVKHGEPSGDGEAGRGDTGDDSQRMPGRFGTVVLDIPEVYARAAR
jgi:hypothetical protein